MADFGKLTQVEGLKGILVRPCHNCGNMKAVFSFQWHGLVVRGAKVMEGAKGRFISMPSRKKGEEWEDVCFFLSPELREQITQEVLSEYDAAIADMTAK